MQLFSNIQDELIARIKQSKVSLKIAVTWFPNHELFDAIISKLDNPEFKLTLIVLNDRINQTFYIYSKVEDFTSFLSAETGFGNVGLNGGNPFVKFIFSNSYSNI